MKLNSLWLPKLWFFGFLFLFLTPFLFPIYKNEVLVLLDEFSANSNQVEQDSLQSEEKINDLETTIDLVNFLLAALTVVPILSGFLLWTLRGQLEKVISLKVEQSVKEKINKLVDNEKKKLEELELEGYIDLIRFSVTREIIPLIEKEYGRTFKRAIEEGFPSLSVFETMESSLRDKLKGYTDLFTNLLNNHPGIFKETLYENYSWIGEAYFLLNQPEKALPFYEKALSKESGVSYTFCSEDSRTLCNFGNVLKALKRSGEALSKYDEALDYITQSSFDYNKNFHSWIFYNRANAKSNLHKYEEAILDYEESLRINPNNYLSLYWKGNALSGLGNFSQAIDVYKSALKVLEEVKGKLDAAEYNPARMWILHGMGDAYRKIGYSCYVGDYKCEQIEKCSVENICYSEALKCYKEAKGFSDFSSQKFEIYQKLGKTKRQLGSYEEANTEYKLAVDLCSEKQREYIPNLLSNWASVRKELGFLDDANQKFKDAIKQCWNKISKCKNLSEKAECYFDIARCYSLQNEPLKANKNIEKAESLGSPEYKNFAKTWAKTDSDFENWYRWYKQQHKQSLHSQH